MGRQAIHFLDEPESALSPRRQVDLLRFMNTLQTAADRQVIMATPSPILMALPGAILLQVTRHGFVKVALRDTPHFQFYAEFLADPEAFLNEVLHRD
jgi:predicted ATPase